MNAKASVNAKRPYLGLKCPDYSTPARVMHTYHYADGKMIHRRRQCGNGHKFSTVEKIQTS